MLNLNHIVKDFEEEVFVGASSGAAAEVASNFCKTLNSGKVFFIPCYCGCRCLSMNYFGS